MALENEQGGEDAEVETGADQVNGESEKSDGGGESIPGEEVKFLIEAGANEDPVLNARLTAEVVAIRLSIGAGDILKFYSALGGGFKNYHGVIKNVGLLSREQEVALARAFRAGGVAVRRLVIDTFTVANQRWVLQLAIKCSNKTGVSLEDCVANGNLGFFKVVPKFDPDSGNKFMTYAGSWIRQCMDRGVADSYKVYRVPVHVCELLSVVSRAKCVLDRNDEDYTDDDVATYILRERVRKRLCGDNGDCSEEDVNKWIDEHPKESRTTRSCILSVLRDGPPGVAHFEDPVGSGGSSSNKAELSELGEFIHSGGLGAYKFPAVGKVENVEDFESRLDDSPVRWAINKIPDMKTRMVVLLRSGIGIGGKDHILEEIGDMFLLTRERVRQIESEGHEFLKEELEDLCGDSLMMSEEVEQREKHYLSRIERADELKGMIKVVMGTENASVILNFIINGLGANREAIAVVNMLFNKRWMYDPLTVAWICGVKYEVIDLVAREVIEKLNSANRANGDIVDLRLFSCERFGRLRWDPVIDEDSAGDDKRARVVDDSKKPFCKIRKRSQVARNTRSYRANVRVCASELMESKEGLDVILRLPMRERFVVLASVGAASDEVALSFDDIAALMGVSNFQIYNISKSAIQNMRERMDIWDFNDGLPLKRLEEELPAAGKCSDLLFTCRAMAEQSDIKKKIRIIIDSVDDKCAKAVIVMLFSETKPGYSILDVVNLFGIDLRAIEQIVEEILGYLRDWPDDNRIRIKSCSNFSYQPRFASEAHKIKDDVEIDANESEYIEYRGSDVLGNVIAIRKSIGLGGRLGVRFSGDYNTSIGAVGDLSTDQQIYLGKVLKYGDDMASGLAGEALILSCLKMITSVAESNRNVFDVDLRDVVQEMNIKVFGTLNTFDIDKSSGFGSPFVTYFSRYLYETFFRAVPKAWSLVDVPNHVFDSWNKVRKATDVLTLISNERDLTPDSIAKEIRFATNWADAEAGDVEQVTRTMPREAISLSKAVRVHDEDGERARRDETLPCDFGWENTYRDPFVSAEEILIEERERLPVLRAIAKISDPLERSIVLLRYGIVGDGEECVLEDVGAIFNRTGERIRQLQRKVEKKSFGFYCRDRYDLSLTSEQQEVFERFVAMKEPMNGEKQLVDEAGALLKDECVKQAFGVFVDAFGDESRFVRAAVVMLFRQPSRFTFRETGIVCGFSDEQVERMAEFVVIFLRSIFECKSCCDSGTAELIAKNLVGLVNGDEDDVSDLDD